MPSGSRVSVAVIGAGPYGLSIAAHLRNVVDDLRIFGRPMESWWTRMPDGMFLKSEGFASNLSDPRGTDTLRAFCAKHNLDYDDYVYPIPVDTFRRYGQSFQKTWVPDIEERLVLSTKQNGNHFELALDNGEIVSAANVIVATGFAQFAHIPAELAGLPKALVSHSSDHVDFARFKGRDVTVIGAGQSALETTALLHEQGANVQIIARRPSVEWNRPPQNRSLLERLTKPRTPLGRGRRAWLYSHTPIVFHHLPEEKRIEIVRHALGPAGAWWLKERVVGRIPLIVNAVARSAEESGGRVKLQINQDGASRETITDHVIAATGYVVDVRRLPFLDPTLVSRVSHVSNTPKLSSAFESSVPGLYFVGLAAATAFGPVMRFAAGSAPTAIRLARHLRRARRRW
jgi:thioredoxin reductase